MIVLKDIYLQNFMSISELSMEFDEDTIVAITGENGSGKSALLYAIAFAITGYRYGEAYKNYVKTKADYAYINLNAIFKGYPINYDIKIMGPNSKSIPPVQKKISYRDKVYLNSEYDQFIKEHELSYVENLMCIFGTGKDIINITPGERAATLRKIFNFEFSDIVKSFRAKQEELKIKNIEYATKINELSSRIFEKQSLLRTLSKQGLADKKDQLCDVNLALSNISNVDEASIKKYEDWLDSVTKSLNRENNELEKDTSNKVIYENYIKDSENIIKDIDEDYINEEINKLEINKKNLETDLESLNEKLTNQNKEISVLDFNVKELKEQVAVCETGICHACGHEIDQAHTDTIKKNYEKTSNSLIESKKISAKIKIDINVQKNKIKDINNLLNNYRNDLITKEKESRKIELNKTKLDNTIKSINERTKNIERLEKDKKRIEEEKIELDKLKPLLDQRKELEEQKTLLEEIIKKTESDWVRNEEKRLSNNQIEKEKNNRDESVKKLTEDQNNLSIEMANTKQCIDIFDTLFPNYIILQACEQLEDYINSIIQRMFPYMKVSLKLNRSGVSFYYLSESSDEDWLTVKMASKAQKKTLSLAYQIALAKMYGLSCILVDEVDDAMSDENAKMIYEFMAGLEDFQQIIFISHRQESINTMMNSGRDNIVMYKVAHGEYEQI